MHTSTHLHLSDLMHQSWIEHQAAFARIESLMPIFLETTHAIIERLRQQGTLLICGNGGSAADAQHFAAELIGRFSSDRPSIRALALTTDSSIMTAVGNDYGYDQIFKRQCEAWCTPKDILIAISTSGNSPNVIAACQIARQKGSYVVAWTGDYESQIESFAHVTVKAPSRSTPRIQEIHEFLGHVLCQAIEFSMYGVK